MTIYDRKQALSTLNDRKEGAAETGLSPWCSGSGTPPAALETVERPGEPRAGEARVIKVAAEKLDKLVDLVGELVIASASAHVRACANRDPGVGEATAQVSKLVEEIRDNAMSLRMEQIGHTFGRFRPVVRDVSLELGKEVDLEIRGAETELDTSIVEKIADPLAHLVLNALDHGIERPEVRRARGKADRGSLLLNAFHESGSIVIEVADDGGGLDRAGIRAKAAERGLVPPDAALTDAEVTGLIFEPGFSTAAQAGDFSGNGMGLDGVRRTLDELHGTVEVESREGSGTLIRIRLPLTLAIIDGFQVEAAGTCYVLPLHAVIECLDLGPFLESEENHLINLRGEVLPFLRLREVFSLGGPAPDKERVVVVQAGEVRAGLVVDRLLGEFQTVIKPLGELFRNVRGLGGSTILGTGEVAVVLDVAQLLALADGPPARP